MPRLSSLMLLLTAFLLGLHAAAVTVVINEFQASNGETIADEDGDFEDWIELYNYGEEPVLLGGYGLSDDEDRPFRWVLPDITLGPGEFLLVFASNKDRTDGVLHTNFAISSAGEEVLLTAPDGTLLDFVPPTPVPRDVSYGRQPDGVGEWYFFDEPTPGTENTTEAFLGVLDPPEFSHEGGFYEEAFSLSASHSDPGATIHYTLDGTIPTSTDPILETSILITDRSSEPDVLSQIQTSPDNFWDPPAGPSFKGTSVRACAHRLGFLPSPSTTRTYFVTDEGSNRYHLPVISIVTSPDNFFDQGYGIYVPGVNFVPGNNRTGNFYERGRDWERPVHIELLDEDGVMLLAQNVGARIHGGGTRVLPLKSLRIYARRAYDEQSNFDFDMFPDERKIDGSELATYKRFILRNTGTFFVLRDLFMQGLVSDLDRIETQAGGPRVVFLNGAFWALQNARTRYDQHHFANMYGLDQERITILANNATLNRGAIADRDAYVAMRQYAADNNLSDSNHYEHISSLMDIQSYIDYYCLQIYIHNTDWPHGNIKFWRYQKMGLDSIDEKAEWWRDGRWRWMLYDTDVGFSHRGPRRTDENSDYLDELLTQFGSMSGPSGNMLRYVTAELNVRNMQKWPNILLRALLDNEDFRNAFVMRFADHLNSRFETTYVLARLEDAQKQFETVMPEHIERWPWRVSSMEQWYESGIYGLGVMRDFAEQRPSYVREHIVDYFDLEGTYELTIAMPPEGSGRVRVNSIELEADGEEWTGIYFLGMPLEVEVIPEVGHTFLGWEGPFEGEDNLLAMTPGSDIALAPKVKDDNVTLTEVVLPRFMQGESPDNNDRVPFSCRLRIEGLLPNAVYRYANRVLSPDDPPTQNGAGNAIYFDSATGMHFRTTDTPDFAEPGTFGEFITDDNGVYEGWFTLEPSGNQRFEEPELFIRILLNDGLAGEEYHHFIKTDNTVRILPFGFGWEEATGLYATSPLTPGEVVVLHDDLDGAGRPLTATLVEDAGFEVDDRYATFYEQFVTGLDGHFGTLLPNLLPDGLQRIEAFDWFTAESTAVYTRQDGFWPDNADTINPDGGLGFPFVLNLGEPDTDRLPGDVNGNGVVNAVDVQLVINAALGIEIDPSYRPDINGNGVVNAVDVQLVINAALGIDIG